MATSKGQVPPPNLQRCQLFREHTQRKAAKFKRLLYGLLKRGGTNQSTTVLHFSYGLKKIILLSVGFLSNLSFPFQWQKSKNI